MRRFSIQINQLYCTLVFLLWLSLCCLIIPSSGFALEPHEVLVVANKSASHSLSLAKYYMEKRGIPKKNLVKLRITDKTWCSREEYKKKVVPVVRDFLKKNDPAGNIRCLVTMYGLPLKIRPPEMTRDEKKQLEDLKKKQKPIKEALQAAPKDQSDKRKALSRELQILGKQMAATTKTDHRASFDSELSLVLAENYSTKGWIPNPYFIGFNGKKESIPKEKVLMVSRLDAPNDKIVKRIIDDSIKAEKTGLRGKAYFDAKWPKPDEKKTIKSAGSLYDKSLHLAAERVEKSKLMPVSVNDKVALFQAGDCPDAALYCGWYSRRTYIDAFDWQPGAVGYHIASSECVTLKAKKSRGWCKMMLEDGAAATLGPVSEPYLQAFPPPEIFFSLLIDGYYTLAESYILSLPYLSWQMVLVGDPLYRPFKNQEEKGDRQDML